MSPRNWQAYLKIITFSQYVIGVDVELVCGTTSSYSPFPVMNPCRCCKTLTIPFLFPHSVLHCCYFFPPFDVIPQICHQVLRPEELFFMSLFKKEKNIFPTLCWLGAFNHVHSLMLNLYQCCLVYDWKNSSEHVDSR